MSPTGGVVSRLAVAALLASCSGTPTTPDAPFSDDARSDALVTDAVNDASPDAAPAGPLNCQRQDFALTLPLPEASGATWAVIDGLAAVLVVADSGHAGAYAVIDPATGEVREQGSLPLGTGASDDLEGLSVHAGRFFAITSSGWVREWRRITGGFDLVDGPYPVATVSTAPDALACDGASINCGPNYEGLCLRTRAAAGACLGFAAAKARGHLLCLTLVDNRLAAEPSGAVVVDLPEVVTGCDFTPDDRLWAGANLFGLSRIYRIDGWQTPSEAQARTLDWIGDGFPEAMAVDGDLVFRFSDTGDAPSLQSKFRCRE
jgi:hypothetical protein